MEASGWVPVVRLDNPSVHSRYAPVNNLSVFDSWRVRDWIFIFQISNLLVEDAPARSSAMSPHEFPSVHTADDRETASLHTLDSGERWSLVVIGLLALAVRVAHIDQPIRLDEARTFINYATRPLAVVLGDWSVPNNHVFHTLLAWLSLHAFGNSEWTLRLPALVAGLLLLPATYTVARRLGGRSAAMFATALAASAPILILYSTNARGYSLICLATMVLVVLVDRQLESPTRGRWARFAVVLALGLWTNPVMVYAAGGICLWFLVEGLQRGGTEGLRRAVVPLFVALAGAALLSAVLYAPVIARSGPGFVTGQRAVVPLAWPAYFDSLPRFGRDLRDSLGLGAPRLALIAVALLAALSLARDDEGRHRRRTLAASVAIWCVLLLLWTRRSPPGGRVWLFMVPLACPFVGVGLSAVTDRLAAWRGWRALRVAAVSALVLAAAVMADALHRRVIWRSDETIALLDAQAVAEYLRSAVGPDDRVVFYPGTGAQIDFYLYARTGQRLALFEAPTRSARLLVVASRFSDRYFDPESVRRGRPDVDFAAYGPPELLKAFDATQVFSLARIAR